ncbi:MAG: hypothetical protein HZC14_00050 [Candidatus Niyogibacteria bacterium]|nr:hypothetical protein [Candidatus Niyogibacteria bacterium]
MEPRVGLILRTYATDSKDVAGRVATVKDAVERAVRLTIGGYQAIHRIDVLVWADKRFAESDCGYTYASLQSALQGVPDVYLSEVRRGDLFCGLLNYGIALQLRNGMDYSIILSVSARSYFNEPIQKGARAVGVAINELSESIHEGRLANTFCLWDNVALMTVGGFDLRAAKIADHQSGTYILGWSKEMHQMAHYQLSGVEEIIPLARLVENFGPCIAAIDPQGEGVQKYELPDPAQQPELYKRHMSKMATKFERQTVLLASIGVQPSFLQSGLIKK